MGEDVLPGRIEAVTNDAIVVQTSNQNVLLLEVQPANKRRMTGGEYARGYGLKPGDVII
jgi:methionyl-tRNA formyltransferase